MRGSPESFHFADDGAIPNSRLPVLVYRSAVEAGGRDPAAAIERVFEANDWPPQWRDGIYPFHHYHSTAHEVLGIAQGKVRVRLGGERGRDFDLGPGDVVVLPAGTGHKRLSERGDLLVIGAYPPGQSWDLLRGDPAERPAALENIARVPMPTSDPVHGKDGPLVRLWNPSPQGGGIKIKRAAMRDWVSFWDSEHPIYVNARHLDLHYRALAEDMVRLVPSKQACVLDHGCGEALHAGRIAAACAELYLCEAAPRVRARLGERFAGERKIRVIAPAEVERMPAASLDLIVANSLAQYLARAELATLLETWRQALKPGGRLVIADVIGPGQSALADALALLRFAAANGFLIAAVRGLARTAFSDYRKLRARLGLTHYSEAEMLALLRGAGFSAERLRPNLGHNQARMAFVASKPL